MREAVVFLPGLMCDARAFGPQLAELSRDRAVMAAPVTEGERIEEIASNLLDVLPKRFALAGHDLGGIVAMEIVRRAPERVARLALMGTHPLADTPQQAAERDPRIIHARTGRLRQALAEDIPPKAVGEVEWRDEILALLDDMAQTLGREVYVRQTRALQRRRDQQAVLRKIAVPTWVICGSADPVTPVKRHDAMAELIPGAKLRVLDGVGHFPSLEAPGPLAEALRDWLAAPSTLR